MIKAINKETFAITVEVDGTKTLEQLIADGKYDWRDPEIKQRKFPVSNTERRIAKIEFFSLSCNMSSEDIIKGMERMYFRPATVEELLALGARSPELQKKFTVFALGSVCREGYVPVLCADDNHETRLLDLGIFGEEWQGDNPEYRRYCFAAVRKHGHQRCKRK